MELKDLIQRALAVCARYAQLEKQLYGQPKIRQELALGFVGVVGALAKPVTACSGHRQIDSAERRLAHELADCLWSGLAGGPGSR